MRTVAPAIRVALCAMLFFAVACASLQPREGDGNRSSSEPARLYVQNNHWSDVTVWIMAGGQRNRLGTVTAARSAMFTLPRHTLSPGGEVRFVADALASLRPMISERIAIFPGAQVAWTLESSLERSSLAVY